MYNNHYSEYHNLTFDDNNSELSALYVRRGLDFLFTNLVFIN